MSDAAVIAGQPYFETLAAGLIDPEQFAPLARWQRDERQLATLRELEAAGQYPAQPIAQLCAIGALRVFASADPAASFSHMAYLTASLTRHNTSLGVAVAVNGLALLPLYLAGDAAQLARADAALAQGKLSCLMLSELEAGSNLGLIRTRYRRLDDGYQLDGAKDLINGAGRHPQAVILARAEDERRYSLFVTPDGVPGRGARRWHTVAARGADISGVDLEQLRLPSSALLGAEGAGFELVRRTLTLSRAGVAFFAAGIAAAASGRARQYAQQRRFAFPAGDKAIAEFDAIAAHLRRQRALELIVAATAWRTMLHVNEDGLGAALYTAVSKYLCTTTAERVVDEGTPVLSARALLRDEPYAQLLTDVRLFPIFDGTTHVILDEIATTTPAYCASDSPPAAYTRARRGVLATCRHKGPRRIVAPLRLAATLATPAGLPSATLRAALADVHQWLTQALDDPAWPLQQTLRHAAARSICLMEGILGVLQLSLNQNRLTHGLAPCAEPAPAIVAHALAHLLRELAGAAADMAAGMRTLGADAVAAPLGQLHAAAVALLRPSSPEPQPTSHAH